MDYTTTEAWARGVELALAQLALQPPDDHTVSVSLDPPGHGDRTYYKLCQLCGWDRRSESCPHQDQDDQLRETRSETEDDPMAEPIGHPGVEAQ